MVKFSELFEFVGIIKGEATCSCCQQKDENPNVYKRAETMVVLCTACEAFLEELLE